MERTLIIVKPEGVQRGLVGNVITRIEQRGLKFVGLKLLQITSELAEQHYGVHKGKPFYPGLVKHITSGPVVVGVVEGPKAIRVVRTWAICPPLLAMPSNCSPTSTVSLPASPKTSTRPSSSFTSNTLPRAAMKRPSASSPLWSAP